MPVAFNFKFETRGILNGEVVAVGDIFAPFLINSALDYKIQLDVPVLGASGSQSIVAWSDQAKFIVITSTVAGTVAWGKSGSANANNAMYIPASTFLLLPGGRTTTGNATTTGRANNANVANVDEIYFDADTSNGVVSVLLVF